jgi:hypothetical protein
MAKLSAALSSTGLNPRVLIAAIVSSLLALPLPVAYFFYRANWNTDTLNMFLFTHRRQRVHESSVHMRCVSPPVSIYPLEIHYIYIVCINRFNQPIAQKSHTGRMLVIA